MSELTVIETGEIVEQMTRVEAERITSRIADKLDSIADNLEQVLPLIGEALTRDAWKALGYASPTAYVSERFAGALSRLPKDIRVPVVGQLSRAGMSTRAITSVTETSVGQAHSDIRAATVQSLNSTPHDQGSTPVAELPSSDHVVDRRGYVHTRPAPSASSPAKPKQSNVSRETELVNDIRLYLNHIGTSKETARLPAEAKRHLIEALEQTINQLKGRAS